MAASWCPPSPPPFARSAGSQGPPPVIEVAPCGAGGEPVGFVRVAKDGAGRVGLRYTGNLIEHVVPGGPAAAAGVQRGMRIVAVDGRPVPNDTLALTRVLAAAPPCFTASIGMAEVRLRPDAHGAPEDPPPSPARSAPEAAPQPRRRPRPRSPAPSEDAEHLLPQRARVSPPRRHTAAAGRRAVSLSAAAEAPGARAALRRLEGAVVELQGRVARASSAPPSHAVEELSERLEALEREARERAAAAPRRAPEHSPPSSAAPTLPPEVLARLQDLERQVGQLSAAAGDLGSRRGDAWSPAQSRAGSPSRGPGAIFSGGSLSSSPQRLPAAGADSELRRLEERLAAAEQALEQRAEEAAAAAQQVEGLNSAVRRAQDAAERAELATQILQQHQLQGMELTGGQRERELRLELRVAALEHAMRMGSDGSAPPSPDSGARRAAAAERARWASDTVDRSTAEHPAIAELLVDLGAPPPEPAAAPQPQRPALAVEPLRGREPQALVGSVKDLQQRAADTDATVAELRRGLRAELLQAVADAEAAWRDSAAAAERRTAAALDDLRRAADAARSASDDRHAAELVDLRRESTAALAAARRAEQGDTEERLRRLEEREHRSPARPQQQQQQQQEAPAPELTAELGELREQLREQMEQAEGELRADLAEQRAALSAERDRRGEEVTGLQQRFQGMLRQTEGALQEAVSEVAEQCAALADDLRKAIKQAAEGLEQGIDAAAADAARALSLADGCCGKLAEMAADSGGPVVPDEDLRRFMGLCQTAQRELADAVQGLECRIDGVDDRQRVLAAKVGFGVSDEEVADLREQLQRTSGDVLKLLTAADERNERARRDQEQRLEGALRGIATIAAAAEQERERAQARPPAEPDRIATPPPPAPAPHPAPHPRPARPAEGGCLGERRLALAAPPVRGPSGEWISSSSLSPPRSRGRVAPQAPEHPDNPAPRAGLWAAPTPFGHAPPRPAPVRLRSSPWP
eukprot:TRINITY_DN307_c0_g2_i2.p1 TRINITY_DN307_c0_g2~~TRINITY_DN307_c0_g2_i2.p1  ORF type:complete len:1005 (+),score=301.94 TRINITY_DN307_c0_g2_i2:69-3017(+)